MLKFKAWLLPVLVFVVVTFVVHIFSLRALPSVYMNAAITRLSERGVDQHAFSVPVRITENSRDIVRPSPDLAYSVCLFDLSDGPIRIIGAGWDGYGSLSVFDSQTNNVFVTSLNNADDGARGVVLKLASDTSTPNALNMRDPATGGMGLAQLELKHPKGVAIIRRLAPTDLRFEAAQRLNTADDCQRL